MAAPAFGWITETIVPTGGSIESTSVSYESHPDPIASYAHVVWYDYDTSQLKHAKSSSYTSWTIETIDGATQIQGRYCSSAAISSLYKVVISYWDQTNNRLKFAESVASGTGNCPGNSNWKCQVVDTATGRHTALAVDTDAAKTVHIIYKDDFQHIRHASAPSPYTAWTTEAVYTGASFGVGDNPSLAIGPDHVPRAVFNSGSAGCVYYVERTSFWSSPQCIANGDTGAIAVDSNNSPQVVWVSGDHLYYAKRVAGTWQIDLSAWSSNVLHERTSIYADASTIPHVSFTTDDFVFHSGWKDGFGWHYQTVSNVAGDYSSVALGASGRLIYAHTWGLGSGGVFFEHL